MSVLSDLQLGAKAILVTLDLPPGVRNHLMYMGFVPEAHVTMLRRAPAGDPTVYAVDGMEVALRHETAQLIHIRPVTTPEVETQPLSFKLEPNIESEVDVELMARVAQ